jgi:hypothetical protein
LDSNVPYPAFTVTTYRASGDTAIDIGRLFSRCGLPGTGRTICLLVGKSIACPNANPPPATGHTNPNAIIPKHRNFFILTPYQLTPSGIITKVLQHISSAPDSVNISSRNTHWQDKDSEKNDSP